MFRAIVFVRTSTDSQEIESQKEKAVEFCMSDGYSRDEIKVIGTCGASAIKQDKIYLADIAEVYKTMEENEIEGFYLDSLDRLARDEEIIVKMKKHCINNKIHFKIADTKLSLLYPNKEVNDMVSVMMSYLAAQAYIEMKIKKERFARGREKNAKVGKYNGGYICYGYEIDKDGFYQVKEDEAKIIREIFELMASDKYSITSLTEELRSRGVLFHGKLINYQMVMAILKNTAYIGYNHNYKYKRIYPRIVSDELYNQAREVLNNNNTKRGKATKHYHFGALLITCPECGRHYVGNQTKGVYGCPSHAAPKSRKAMGEELCHNKLSVNIGHIDGLLWSVASNLHYKYIKGLDEEKAAEIKEEIAILELKIKESPKLLKEITERYERLDDVYLLGRMSKEKFNQMSAAIKTDEDKIKNDIAKYKEDVDRLKNLLTPKSSNEKWQYDNFLMSQINGEENEKMMYDFTHKYLKDVRLEKTTVPDGAVLNSVAQSNNQGADFSGRNCVKITITTVDDEEIEVYYLPMINYAHKMYHFTEIVEGKIEFTDFEYEPILRESTGMATTKSVKIQKAFIEEMRKVLEQADDKRETYTYLVLEFVTKTFKGIFGENEKDPYRAAKEAFYQLYCLKNPTLLMVSLDAVGRLYIAPEEDFKTKLEEIMKI